MTIEITSEIKEEALKHSDERLKYEYNRFGLNTEQRKSMILIGTIGQLVFKQFLLLSNIEFNFEFQAGKYDELDFEINGDIIEIKTSGYEDSYLHLNLLYSEDQFQRGKNKSYKYCVIIFINGYNRKHRLLDISKCNIAVIQGYIEFNDIVNFKHVKQFFGDDYKVPLQRLENIKDLIGKYK